MEHDAVIGVSNDPSPWGHTGDRLVHPVQGNQGQQGRNGTALWRPSLGGKEVVTLHDPRLEPRFELPTDPRSRLDFGQKSIMTDAVKAFGNIDL
jgi:hypothetical protein